MIYYQALKEREGRMLLKPGPIYLGATFVGIVLISMHHLGRSFGDEIFLFLGLSPWVQMDGGSWHPPVIFGILLLIVGIRGAARSYDHPKLAKRLIIGCILFAMVSPTVSKGVMFTVKYFASGISSLDYAKEGSSCSTVQYSEDVKQLTTICTFTVYNYGEETNVRIRPIRLMNDETIEFDFQSVELIPHQKNSVTAEYRIYARDSMAFYSGRSNEIGAELELFGETKSDK
jgi:hypothetical protein